MHEIHSGDKNPLGILDEVLHGIPYGIHSGDRHSPPCTSAWGTPYHTSLETCHGISGRIPRDIPWHTPWDKRGLLFRGLLFIPHRVSHGSLFRGLSLGNSMEYSMKYPVRCAMGPFPHGIPSRDISWVLFIPCGIPWGSHGTPVGPTVYGVSPRGLSLSSIPWDDQDSV